MAADQTQSSNSNDKRQTINFEKFRHSMEKKGGIKIKLL